MDKSEHQQQQQPQPQQESTLESHSMGNKNIASGKISASISNQEATTPAQSLPITSTIINPQPLAPQQQPAIDTSSREMASHLKSLEVK